MLFRLSAELTGVILLSEPQFFNLSNYFDANNVQVRQIIQLICSWSGVKN